MSTADKKKNRTCMIPGSFDPMTVGHIELVKRASELFDTVVVAVMNNTEKTYLFDIEERKKIAEAGVKDIPGVKVISSCGMTAETYERCGACALVKGVRNRKDFGYELLQSDFNFERPEKCETVFLPARPGQERISSTRVRRELEKGKIPAKLLAPEAARLIGTIISERKKNEKTT